MTCQIIHGDCKTELQNLINAGIKVDSIVTDPPYELGFMNKKWDNTGIAYDVEMWTLCLEILKPGGHLLSFGGSRTYHRMACAIEDAGFEIRDQIMWIYGQGFPKSLDISKAIDKMKGAERTEFYTIPEAYPDSGCWSIHHKNSKGNNIGFQTQGSSTVRKDQNGNGNTIKSIPKTDLAKQWDGWGTALKPAHEPIVLARKPLSEKTVAENVIKHGTGGINIDRCRVNVNKDIELRYDLEQSLYQLYNTKFKHGLAFGDTCKKNPDFLNKGRFPANLIHDGSDEVEEKFAKYGESKSCIRSGGDELKKIQDKELKYGYKVRHSGGFTDNGTPSRFFYSSKASAKDRQGSKHPTIKPLSLMRYLCRLITPPNGTILDHFAGTGTTGQAALEESFKAILIEKEDEYIQDINKRMNSIVKTLF